MKEKKDQEPSISMMEAHIKQLAPILNKYENCITAIEAGMIGPWGEMHSSACANKETINKNYRCIFKKMLIIYQFLLELLR
ncbi:MAG: DUF4874 domain-containing protein [Clostridium sp.]|nr:MAG: DUF4874 domain-containing protein [Clostridium sp.]